MTKGEGNAANGCFSAACYKSGERWKNKNNFRLRDIKDIITALEKVNEKMRVRFSGNFAREEIQEP
jgi:hypothetical protein